MESLKEGQEQVQAIIDFPKTGGPAAPLVHVNT